MAYLIRGGLYPGSPNSLYRGTYRKEPTYVGNRGDADEVNALFLNWYLPKCEESGEVEDLETALRWVRLLNNVQDQPRFEILSVSRSCAPQQPSRMEFLGYDLSVGYGYSLLESGLHHVTANGDASWARSQLSGLIQAFYRPKLNGYGLFDSRKIAEDCLESMAALQSLTPNLYESGPLKEQFQVVPVHLIIEDA